MTCMHNIVYINNLWHRWTQTSTEILIGIFDSVGNLEIWYSLERQIDINKLIRELFNQLENSLIQSKVL